MLLEQHNERSLFEIDNFRTGNIVLPGLGFTAHFKNGVHYFRYDGLVSSLREHIDVLPYRLKEPLIGFNTYQLGGFNCGYVLNPNKPNCQMGFLMVVKNISQRLNISNEGHEVAEIMFQLGMINQLVEGLKSQGFNINLSGLGVHQVGVIGGFVAAKINEFDVSELYQEQDPEGYLLLQQLGLV